MSDASTTPTEPDDLGDDTPSPDEATALSRAQEIEIKRQLTLGLEEFEGGIEG